MIPPESPQDLWESAGAYDRFMGRWSRELARTFVSWVNVPPDRHWLEVGCGTGALTSAILEVGRPASVVATDSSEQFVAHTRDALADRRVQCFVAAADSLPSRPEGYDAVASCLVLNFIPDPVAALRDMGTLAADGGTIAACVWDYSDGMGFLRRFWDAAVALDPSARQYDEGERFPICSPSGLMAAFRGAGLSSVQVEALEVETRFRNFDDYWSPFIGGPGPAPGYLASLSAQRQQDLANRLEATLPRHGDGTLNLTAKAWTARAQAHSAA